MPMDVHCTSQFVRRLLRWHSQVYGQGTVHWAFKPSKLGALEPPEADKLAKQALSARIAAYERRFDMALPVLFQGEVRAELSGACSEGCIKKLVHANLG